MGVSLKLWTTEPFHFTSPTIIFPSVSYPYFHYQATLVFPSYLLSISFYCFILYETFSPLTEITYISTKPNSEVPELFQGSGSQAFSKFFNSACFIQGWKHSKIYYPSIEGCFCLQADLHQWCPSLGTGEVLKHRRSISSQKQPIR
jgi:hypothetical protein